MRAAMRAVIFVLLAACADQPLAADPPSPIVVVSWDPFACTGRVAAQLTGSAGEVAGSAPCGLGELVLEVPGFGAYRARVNEREQVLVVDQAVVELAVDP